LLFAAAFFGGALFLLGAGFSARSASSLLRFFAGCFFDGPVAAAVPSHEDNAFADAAVAVAVPVLSAVFLDAGDPVALLALGFAAALALVG
jgi:hypothetical protein